MVSQIRRTRTSGDRGRNRPGARSPVLSGAGLQSHTVPGAEEIEGTAVRTYANVVSNPLNFEKLKNQFQNLQQY